MPSILAAVQDRQIFKQGAEAKLYTGKWEDKPVMAKERFKKNYRIDPLDKSLNKRRTKMEEKILVKSSQLGINVPKVYKTDLENGVILMEYIEDSVMSRDYIIKNKNDTQLLEKLASKIGKVIGKLHSNHIIHGDLTTSNMLIKNADQEDYALYMIDFGLSMVSTGSSQVEDKAVDLYVLERALLSTPSMQAEFIFDAILKSYQIEMQDKYSQVYDRLNEVRLRGRKRSMIG